MNSSRTRASHALFALASTLAVPAFAAPGSTSVYVTDLQTSQVEDATSRGIGDVNMIACIMHAMRPEALVNQPSYIALIDKNKCDSEKRSSSSNASNNDGTQAAADYITATVTSTRESNTAPMISKVWLDLTEEGAHVQISVHVSATEAPSESNPYGAFRLDYCGQIEGTGDCVMHGYLEAANGGINYYDYNAGGNETTAMNLTVNSSGGTGKLEGHGGGGPDTNFAFAYDGNLFRRDIGGTNGDQCFSRDASDPDTGFSVWRYGVYDASTGARVTRNSGFPIEYTTGGTTYNGYLGYYGISLPPDAASHLVNDDVVTKVDYSSNSDTPTRTDYHVVKTDGKLIKYTKRTTTLAHLDQIRLNTFTGMDGNAFFTGAAANSQFEVYWDEASGTFIVSGQIQCNENGCQTSAVAPGLVVASTFWVDRGGIQGWSQSLGGEVFIDLHGVSGAIVSSAVPVTYRSQDLVYPGDSTLPAALHCLQNCPTQASLAAYFTSQDPNNPASPYAGSSYNNFVPTDPANVVDYTVDATTGVLLDSTSGGVTYSDAEAFSGRPQYSSGVMSGRLFADLTMATCDVMGGGGGTAYCDWKVNDADVYYQWQTGPNNWNQFVAVKDNNGEFVPFDPPLQLNFHVPTGSAYGQYANTNIILQYGGFGDLWGIPGTCVSANTNEPVDCSTSDSRYVPAFVIPYDQTLGVATSTGDDHTQYLVKWLEREIRFARKTSGECSSLTLPANAPLPDASALKNPTDSTSDIYIGVKPQVTDAPRVIQGDVKY